MHYLIPVSIALVLLIYFLSQDNREISQVCLNKDCFLVELARTAAEQERGLMNRESLPEDRGMLFIFGKTSIYPFWMKNTLIPLDIIWIDQNHNIVAIKKAVPCTTPDCEVYEPYAKALYVLELNAGEAEKSQAKVGDKVEFRYS